MAFDRETQVRFWRNGGAIETDSMVTTFSNDVANGAIDIPFYFLDSSLLEHFIGGVRHNWKLMYAFTGYLYEIHVT